MATFVVLYLLATFVQALDVTPISKVTEMLQDMKAKSEALRDQAATDYAEAEALCNQARSNTQSELDQQTLQVSSAEASVGSLNLEVAVVKTNLEQDATDYVVVSTQLEDLRRQRAKNVAAYEKDLSSLSAAIAGVERALQVLRSTATPATFVQAQRGAAVAGIVARRLRGGAGRLLVHRSAVALRALTHVGSKYTPDSGGMQKDEHIFDEFESLNTADRAYTSQITSGTGPAGLLEHLEAQFKQHKDAIISTEKAAKGNFQLEEQRLIDMIMKTKNLQAMDKELLAMKQGELQAKAKQLAEGHEAASATGDFLEKLSASCVEKQKAYVEMKQLRDEEIVALGKAIQIISGAPHSSSAASLLRLPRASPSRAMSVPNEDVAASIVNFLRLRADKLGADDMDGLAQQVMSIGKSFVTTGSALHEDPLAKVKDMIRSLIIKLEKAAVEESTHKAWCDDELAKNEHAREGAAEDIKKYTLRASELSGQIAKLEIEVEDLNVSLASEPKRWAKIQAKRDAESQSNTAEAKDADESAQAAQAAIIVLEDYYKNAAKKVALLESMRPNGTRGGEKATMMAAVRANKTRITAEPMPVPDSLTAPETKPLLEESSGVIGMLEVVRDRYSDSASKIRSQEQEADRTHHALSVEHNVKMTETTKDRNYKLQQIASLTQQLETAKSDLGASSTTLNDSQVLYEDLKAPCLTTETFEERKAKRDQEIASLEEAVSMLDDMASGTSGGSLLSMSAGQRVVAPAAQLEGGNINANTTAAEIIGSHGSQNVSSNTSVVASSKIKRDGQAESAHAFVVGAAAGVRQPNQTQADSERLAQIIDILEEIRTEVAADLEQDTGVHENYSSWCKETVLQVQTAIAEENERDRDLVTEIETSVHSKESLEVQLKHLKTELAREQASLEASASLREQEQSNFKENEKELLESIHALNHALVVLSRHFNSSDPNYPEERDLAMERDDIEAEKPEGYAAALVRVAGEVRKALGSLPASELGAAMGSAESDSAVLQNFLARPQALLQRRSPVLALEASGAHRASGAVDGGQVYGILSQLLATFKKDLEAAQSREAKSEQDYEALRDSKKAQIDALVASITSKEEQLAHYTTLHTDAKEDVTYLRAARSEDVQYLMDVQEQCAGHEREFQERNTTRHNELSSLAEAIDILRAEESMAKDEAAPEDTGGTNMLLRRQAPARVAVAKPVPGAIAMKVTSTTLPPKPVEVLDAFLRARRPPTAAAAPRSTASLSAVHVASPPPEAAPLPSAKATRPNTKAGLAGAATSSVGRWDAAGRRLSAVALKVHAPPHVRLDTATSASRFAMSRHDLAALSTQLKLAHLQGNAFNDALNMVISQIETVKRALVKEAYLEVKMRDTCINEEHLAKVQKERRVAEESGHNASLARLASLIDGAETQIAAIRQDIKAIEASMVEAEVRREEEYEAYNKSVRQQLDHQSKLTQAENALRMHYGFPAAESSSLLALGVQRIAGGGPNVSRTMGDINRSRTEKPESFARPLQAHNSSRGVLAILGMLLDNSRALVKSTVDAEDEARQAHAQEIAQTKRTVEEKDRQAIVLEGKRGAWAVEQQEASSEREACQQEIQDIDIFFGILADKCNVLLQNFDSNQKARAEEVRGLLVSRVELRHVEAAMTDLGDRSFTSSRVDASSSDTASLSKEETMLDEEWSEGDWEAMMKDEVAEEEGY